MEKITSVAGLKNAIQLLEEEQAIKQQMLREQFYLIYDSFKPAKLIGITLKQMFSSPDLIENVIDTSLSLATGYFAKKAIVGVSGNIIRRIVGAVMQYGVTNFLSKNADDIRSVSKLVFQRIFSKKEKSEET
ncbi:MAG: hypothetical protein K0B08_01350 [Bacteroidales bacterium]|nr:hypothetical protein [Bacteroidales bacterium]